MAGALMLFRDRVPVRDSRVLRSCGGTGGGADTGGWPAIGPSSQRGNAGGADENWEGERGHSKFPVPLPSPPLPPPPHPLLLAAWIPGLKSA